MVYTVSRLDEFSHWLKGLKDGATRLRLIKRLRKVQLGNLGTCEQWARASLRCGNTSARAGVCTTSSAVTR